MNTLNDLIKEVVDRFGNEKPKAVMLVVKTSETNCAIMGYGSATDMADMNVTFIEAFRNKTSSSEGETLQ